MSNFSIEKLQPRDRQYIRKICCDTGYAGEDISPHIDDSEMFADFWTIYYTDYEPYSGFVARVGGETVGYLNGCLDSHFYNHIMATKILPLLLKKCLWGNYRMGKKTALFVKGMLGELQKGNIYPPLDLYPAHLHINIAAPYRRIGIGEALISSYLAYLRDKGVPGVHLGTTNLNYSAVTFYEKLGFELFSRTENNTFKDRKAYSLTYVKNLL